MSKSTRRKTNLVDPETQISLLKRVSFHWVSFIVTNCIALIIWQLLFELELGSTWGEAGALFLQRYTPFLIISAAMLPIFLHDTLKMSNKFAGPIQRLRRSMTLLAEGSHVPPLSFRKGDFMQGIVTDFNQVVARCQSTENNATSEDAAPGESENPQDQELVAN